MKTPWIRILHTGGYPASSCSPLWMCVYGHISSGCLCSDSSPEFLIFSPGMFHLSPYPAPHTRDGQSFPLLSPEGSLCRGFSSHKWKITLSWTLDIPIFKSLLAVPLPGSFSLALFSPKSHPHFIFQNLLSASSSHLFPACFCSWAPHLLPQILSSLAEQLVSICSSPMPQQYLNICYTKQCEGHCSPPAVR